MIVTIYPFINHSLIKCCRIHYMLFLFRMTNCIGQNSSINE
ncbi:hypothetical protein ATN83_p10027 (plasmid) [Raoultella ornithinolytica]|nr:hypothetical protein ATN83_p10027 [Raoultella ornithinolytica]